MVKAIQKVIDPKWIEHAVNGGADIKSDRQEQLEKELLEAKKELLKLKTRKSKFVHLRLPSELLAEIDRQVNEDQYESRNQWMIDGLESLCTSKKSRKK